jgi:hypothetical protein
MEPSMALPISLPQRGSCLLLRDLHRQLGAGRRHCCTLMQDTLAALIAEGHALGVHYVRRPVQRGLLFGYGAIEENAIAEGLARLRRALRLVNPSL